MLSKSKLDSEIEVHEKRECSDHHVIVVRVKLPNRQPQSSVVRIPQRQRILEVCQEAQKKAENTLSLIEEHKKLAQKHRITKTVRLTLRERQPTRVDLKELVSKIDDALRTSHSK